MPEAHWSKPPRHVTVCDLTKKKPKRKEPCRCPYGSFFCGGIHK